MTQEPKMALGTMHFGTKVDTPTAHRILDRYVEGGGVWIDTANCYAFWGDDSGHGGQSETVIGAWLAARPGVRDRIKLSTKVGAEPLEPGGFPQQVEGLSDRAIRDAVVGSLTRLGVDRLDLLWAHMEDRTTPLRETTTTFGELIEDGTIGSAGWSNHPIWRVAEARLISEQESLPPVTAIQQRTSYLHPRPDTPVAGQDHPFGMMTAESIDYAATYPDCELWAYTPLLTGAYDRSDRPLAEAYDHPGATARMRALEQVAETLNVPRSEVVLAWLVAQQPAIRPIVGVSSPEQLDNALDGIRLNLTTTDRQNLSEAN